jgi:predicted 3-demethylubiquinone-9 3-methyltransferase (glyoxalase superfamily)
LYHSFTKLNDMQNQIYPCLWFDGQAKTAAAFYCSVFKNSKIVSETPLVVMFELNGNKFMGLNAGPQFKFNEAVSFVVNCKDQDEIDYFWDKLSDGGQEVECGWVKDRFGVSWQVVPSILGELMSEPAKAERVIAAVMKMKKLDLEVMKNA